MIVFVLLGDFCVDFFRCIFWCITLLNLFRVTIHKEPGICYPVKILMYFLNYSTAITEPSNRTNHKYLPIWDKATLVFPAEHLDSSQREFRPRFQRGMNIGSVETADLSMFSLFRNSVELCFRMLMFSMLMASFFYSDKFRLTLKLNRSIACNWHNIFCMLQYIVHIRRVILLNHMTTISSSIGKIK